MRPVVKYNVTESHKCMRSINRDFYDVIQKILTDLIETCSRSYKLKMLSLFILVSFKVEQTIKMTNRSDFVRTETSGHKRLVELHTQILSIVSRYQAFRDSYSSNLS